MARGSGTRSGLLWEVERLLKECNELGNIPDVLVMENVTEVHGQNNAEHFREWIDFLDSLGYSSYYEDLNAADFGVAQHRERCFMVSILGEYNFKFPVEIPLSTVMADYLEEEVDEKYYIKSQKAYDLIIKLIDNGTLETENPLNERTNERTNERVCVDGTINEPGRRDVANCIKARYDAGISNLRSDGNCIVE